MSQIINTNRLVSNSIAKDGYNTDQIAAGLAYAREHCDYRSQIEVYTLAMSRILYSDAQLESGTKFVIEPGKAPF